MLEAKDKKTRTWTFVVYPYVDETNGAPKNWRLILDDLHIPWIESPLHDKDTNPDGEIKKAHWHIMLIFDGPQRYTAAKAIADRLNSPVPQSVASGKGMVRYMIHLDNPEKFQYERSEIIGHSGADVDGYFELTGNQKQKVLREVVEYIRDKHIIHFSELVYLAIEKNDDWFDVIANRNTLFLKELIKSEWQKNNK